MARSRPCWAVVLYPVGTIVFCAVLLFFGRSKLVLAEASSPYTRSIAFLHAPFVPSYFYFDLLELCKKLLLIGFASLIKPGSIMQIMIAVLVSLLFLVLHLQSLPYRRHLDNMLATTIHLGLCVFFICGRISLLTEALRASSQGLVEEAESILYRQRK